MGVESLVLVMVQLMTKRALNRPNSVTAVAEKYIFLYRKRLSHVV